MLAAALGATALAGCSGQKAKNDVELATLVHCQDELKSRLRSPQSFELKIPFKLEASLSEGLLSGDYTAANGFGLQVIGTLHCIYDVGRGGVRYLKTFTPDGEHVMIDEAPSQVEATSNAQ